MPAGKIKGIALVLLLSLLATGCFKRSYFSPPFNNFKTDPKRARQLGAYGPLGFGAGAGAGAAVAGFPIVGAAVGGAAGILLAQYRNSQLVLLEELQKQDIQVIKYGDTMTMLVPTDRYFEFNSPHLNDICYPGLVNIVRLIKSTACGPIYVAGFTDNVGSRYHKKMLSQAQAETMLTFLWANDIAAQRLHAEGYGDKHDIGDNHLIRGSAYNRRVEIQWLTSASFVGKMPAQVVMK